MKKKIERKLKSPMARSLGVHLVVIFLVVLAVYFEPSSPPAVPIEIENISFQKRVKRTFHKAIHTIGIPHTEPVDEMVNESIKEVTPQTNESASADADPSGGIAPNEMQLYIMEVVKRIERNKKYPKDAQFNEQEGMVELSMEVLPDGTIQKSEILKKTPFDSLNQSALAAVQKIGSLPPLPPKKDGTPASKPIVLRIPIHFQLK